MLGFCSQISCAQFFICSAQFYPISIVWFSFTELVASSVSAQDTDRAVQSGTPPAVPPQSAKLPVHTQAPACLIGGWLPGGGKAPLETAGSLVPWVIEAMCSPFLSKLCVLLSSLAADILLVISFFPPRGPGSGDWQILEPPQQLLSTGCPRLVTPSFCSPSPNLPSLCLPPFTPLPQEFVHRIPNLRGI